MKKLLLALLSVLIIACSFGLIACNIKKPKHIHDYKTLNYNQIEHWLECSCGAKKDKEAHKGGELTTESAICTVCDSEYIPLPTLVTDNLVFSLINNNTEYAITGYTGDLQKIYIPSLYQGKPITAIRSSAFTNCTFIKTIQLPNSVESIDFGALSGCTSLEKLIIPFVGSSSKATINAYIGYIFGLEYPTETEPTHQTGMPSSLKEIIVTGNTKLGAGAFAYCESLERIEIAEGVTEAGYGAFAYCTNLTEIVLPQSLKTFNYGTFAYCSSLESITLSSSTTSISEAMFAACFALKSIVIPNTVTTINDYAFGGCYALSSVVVGSGVTTIGYGAFNECYALEVVTMGNSVKSIGGYAFYDCKVLKGINLSIKLTSIGTYAFYDCSSLTSITIPKTVTFIGNRAFFGCNALTILCMANDKKADWDAEWNFAHCPVVENCNNNAVADDGNTYTVENSIRYAIKDGVATVVRQPSSVVSASIPTSISYNGSSYNVTSISDRAFYGCKELTSIIISSTITSIGDYAFYNCDKLTSVIVPSSVTAIGAYAFAHCDKLNSVSLSANLLSIGSYAFYYCSSLTIYCEAESQPSGWSSDWNYSNCLVVWGYKG